MNVQILRSAAVAIRTLDEDERRKVNSWLDHLANWDNDQHTRELSRPSIYKDVYVLNTTDDLRIFFGLDREKQEINVLDIAVPSRFQSVNGNAAQE